MHTLNKHISHVRRRNPDTEKAIELVNVYPAKKKEKKRILLSNLYRWSFIFYLNSFQLHFPLSSIFFFAFLTNPTSCLPVLILHHFFFNNLFIYLWIYLVSKTSPLLVSRNVLWDTFPFISSYMSFPLPASSMTDSILMPLTNFIASNFFCIFISCFLYSYQCYPPVIFFIYFID